VSGFIYETDATFNTNSLKLPLSVMVSIDNTRATFPVAYCYITSESAVSFKWIAEQLTELAFWDCPKPTLIVGDFSKGLGAAVVAKAAADLAAKAVDGVTLELRDEAEEPNLDPNFPEAAKAVVGEGEGQRVQRVKLQLCEWHAIQAIKRRLVLARRYKKDKREEIINKINAWVKADIDSLDEKRDELLKDLHANKQAYICKNYQLKELQFCRAYT
jgi:MULE transposase domain